MCPDREREKGREKEGENKRKSLSFCLALNFLISVLSLHSKESGYKKNVRSCEKAADPTNRC